MKILVIDDENIILTAVQRVFKHSGHEVLCLNNGANALQTVASFEPNFVFLDVKMPGDSGIDVLMQLKHRYPNLKIIMMSGYTSSEILDDAKKAGADAFIKKPFDNIFDLVKIVDNMK